MIAHIVAEDAPPPPRRVVLNMSEDEARTLLHITCANMSVPKAVRSFTDLPEGRTQEFLNHAKDALKTAGVRL